MICEAVVGARTRVWPFAVVAEGARVGEDCNICSHVFVEGGAVIGNRVTVKCGVQVWDGVVLDDDVFVGPNATFTNDPFPRSKQPPAVYTGTHVRKGASIGANATILPGLDIGAGAMIGAGAVVTHSVPANAIVAGNPARITGYADAPRRSAKVREADELEAGGLLVPLEHAVDLRGRVAVAEHASLPFKPRRTFFVYGVPSAEVRGEHAHYSCSQLLVCVHGQVRCLVDDGWRRAEYLLNDPTVGLHVPPLHWGSQFGYSPDAVLAVLASHPYNELDYIKSYDEFVQIARGRSEADV